MLSLIKLENNVFVEKLYSNNDQLHFNIDHICFMNLHIDDKMKHIA